MMAVNEKMEDKEPNRDALQSRIGKPLLTWGFVNAFVGLVNFFVTLGILRGILLQCLIWGAIDTVIALITLSGKRRRPLEKLREVLFKNTYLDVGFLILGIILIVINISDIVTGSGIGIIIQGGFLLATDGSHARHVKGLLEHQ